MEKDVLCAANSYEQKFYFNPVYADLPLEIKQELQIICVTFTEECGGTLLMEFAQDGTLLLNVEVRDEDYLFDDIESGIQIGRIQREKEELFTKLELYHKAKNELKNRKS